MGCKGVSGAGRSLWITNRVNPNTISPHTPVASEIRQKFLLSGRASPTRTLPVALGVNSARASAISFGVRGRSSGRLASSGRDRDQIDRRGFPRRLAVGYRGAGGFRRRQVTGVAKRNRQQETPEIMAVGGEPRHGARVFSKDESNGSEYNAAAGHCPAIAPTGSFRTFWPLTTFSLLRLDLRQSRLQ